MPDSNLTNAPREVSTCPSTDRNTRNVINPTREGDNQGKSGFCPKTRPTKVLGMNQIFTKHLFYPYLCFLVSLLPDQVLWEPPSCPWPTNHCEPCFNQCPLCVASGSAACGLHCEGWGGPSSTRHPGWKGGASFLHLLKFRELQPFSRACPKCSPLASSALRFQSLAYLPLTSSSLALIGILNDSYLMKPRFGPGQGASSHLKRQGNIILFQEKLQNPTHTLR